MVAAATRVDRPLPEAIVCSECSEPTKATDVHVDMSQVAPISVTYGCQTGDCGTAAQYVVTIL